jgi:hypothetical protein
MPTSLQVVDQIPGIDSAGFLKAAEAAKKGNVQVDMDARLE